MHCWAGSTDRARAIRSTWSSSDEPPHWGASSSNPIADPNVRLEALIAAAQRGATVRLLLDRYFDVPTATTSNEATRQYIESLHAEQF